MTEVWRAQQKACQNGSFQAQKPSEPTSIGADLKYVFKGELTAGKDRGGRERGQCRCTQRPVQSTKLSHSAPLKELSFLYAEKMSKASKYSEWIERKIQ